MTLEENIGRLKSLQSKVKDILPVLTLQGAQTGVSIVKDRSIEEGIYKDGLDDNYVAYSANLIPTWFFKGKERNQAGRKYIQENPLGNWKGFRNAQGLDSDNVNLSYTNRMWTSYGSQIKVVQYGPGVFRAIVDASDDEERKKMAYNVERYGNFMVPTEDERLRIAQDQKDELDSLIAQLL